MKKLIKCLAAAGFLGLGAPLSVTAGTSICDDAARQAARDVGVPEDVMLALTRTETGRSREGKLQPWPWTVNMQGKGYWFATKSEALTFATLHHDAGARSFDVGCFQVNFKWHGHAFRSLSDMFDPENNADYAARFIKDLKKDAHTWSDAAGAYHSKTPELKTRYQSRFEDIFAAVQSRRPSYPSSPSAPQNRYPLLETGQGSGVMGSLFRRQSQARKPLFSLAAES